MNGRVRFVRLPEVLQQRACSRASLYRAVAAGTFPPPIRRGRRTSVWVEAEVTAVLAGEVAGMSPEELRDLVARVVAGRGASAHSDIVASAPRDPSGKFVRAAPAALR